MCPRTVTLYMSPRRLCGIPNPLAEPAVAACREISHHRRKIVECAFAADERVELWRASQQLESERHPAFSRPTRLLRRRDCTNLRRFDRQPPGVKAAAEREGHLRRAVPAQLEDQRFNSGQV